MEAEQAARGARREADPGRAGHHGVVTNQIEQPEGNPPPEPGSDASGRTADEPADTREVTGVPAIYTAVNRPRGLNAYFAPGGEDEATAERRADERRNLRLLLLMVAALVLIPTLLTIAALAQELIAHRGG